MTGLKPYCVRVKSTRETSALNSLFCACNIPRHLEGKEVALCSCLLHGCKVIFVFRLNKRTQFEGHNTVLNTGTYAPPITVLGKSPTAFIW